MNPYGMIEHIGIQDGLPDLKIECVYESEGGVLWVGTQDRGVVKIDGNKSIVFDQDKEIANQSIYCISKDKKHTLVFGTSKGLFRKIENGFELVHGTENYSFFWGANADSKGNLWFGVSDKNELTAKILCWDGKVIDEVIISEDKNTNESINSIFYYNNSIWAGGDNLYEICLKNNEVKKVNNEDIGIIYSMTVNDSGDGLLIGTNSGVWRFKDGQIEIYIKLENCISIYNNKERNEINAIDYNGKFVKFKDGYFEIIYDFKSIITSRIYMDMSGRYWIGTYGMGLFCFDLNRMEIYGEYCGLQDVRVNSVYQDEENIYWIGSRSDVISFDGERFYERSKVAEIFRSNYCEFTR